MVFRYDDGPTPLPEDQPANMLRMFRFAGVPGIVRNPDWWCARSWPAVFKCAADGSNLLSSEISNLVSCEILTGGVRGPPVTMRLRPVTMRLRLVTVRAASGHDEVASGYDEVASGHDGVASKGRCG